MAAVPETALEPLREPRSCAHLFWVFTRMALQGFGGVLAVAQHELVERERWLSRDEFLELLSVGQVLPGPNVVNLSLMIGDRFFGLRGAASALTGMLLVPLVLMLSLAVLYGHYADNPRVAGALRGMGAVSAGLVLATAWKLLGSLRKNPLGLSTCLAFGAATVVLVAVLRVPLAWVIASLGVIAVGLAWWRLRP
jgi:chromate transporter